MANKQSNENIFQKLFGSLFGGKDPEAEKKRQLKNIAKNITKVRFKYFKPKSEEALPALGKLFWDLYKAISPVQLMFMANENPNYFKSAIISHSMGEEQKTILENLSSEAIAAAAAKTPFDQLQAKVKKDCETLMACFDMDKINSIDALYTKLMKFKEFCMFDFYFILKKYDSSVRERDFSSSPRLNAINASYIADDLKEFASVCYQLPFNEDWSDLMAFFKDIKGTEPIKPALWQKILTRLGAIKTSGVLDMMIQLISKDPSYFTEAEGKSEHIVESYLDKIRKEANDELAKQAKAQQNSKVDSLVSQIFSSTNINRMKNYTEAKSENFDRRGLGKYEYAKPMNYLKEFLVEFVKKDVRIYSDIILVRGQWVTAALSSPMSDAYNNMLAVSDKITEFDEKLADDKEIGAKLKTLAPRLDRDREAQGIVKTTLRDCNSLAKELVTSATRDLVTYAKNTKALLEDHQKKEAEMIINWKELDHFAENTLDEGNLQSLGVNIYKKIYLFANLMQTFIK